MPLHRCKQCALFQSHLPGCIPSAISAIRPRSSARRVSPGWANGSCKVPPCDWLAKRRLTRRLLTGDLNLDRLVSSTSDSSLSLPGFAIDGRGAWPERICVLKKKTCAYAFLHERFLSIVVASSSEACYSLPHTPWTSPLYETRLDELRPDLLLRPRSFPL